MQIGVGLIFRWFAILASLVDDFAQRRRARRTVVVKAQGDSFVVERVSGADRTPIASVPMRSSLPADAAQRLRNYAIDFELGDTDVVSRRLTVPAQARDVLPGIVRNQIERLSPWPLAKTAYGFEAMK